MTGEGPSFCAGSDVNDMCEESGSIFKRDVEEVYSFQHEMSEVILYMRRAPQPIIAAVRGYAAGGGFSFAMAADIRLADPTAKFVASYINIGLTAADMGSSYLFPRQVNLGPRFGVSVHGGRHGCEDSNPHRVCQSSGIS